MGGGVTAAVAVVVLGWVELMWGLVWGLVVEDGDVGAQRGGGG